MTTNAQEIGERLQAERKRLGLSQSDFAQAAGVTRSTQSLYETGAGSPDGNYLSSAAKLGVDIVFVLVGAGTLDVRLTPKEIILVDCYRRCPEGVRNGVFSVVETAANMKASKGVSK